MRSITVNDAPGVYSLVCVQGPVNEGEAVFSVVIEYDPADTHHPLKLRFDPDTMEYGNKLMRAAGQTDVPGTELQLVDHNRSEAVPTLTENLLALHQEAAYLIAALLHISHDADAPVLTDGGEEVLPS